MTKPSADDFATAAEWLGCYDEGDSENHASCQRVARWLIQRAEQDTLRAACREAGVKVADVRARLNGL